MIPFVEEGDYFFLKTVIPAARQAATTRTKEPTMPNQIDHEESELLQAFEQGELKSIASKSELAKFKAAAGATALKDRRVNIRMSSGDLSDIQVKALEEGIPYQTLIASVLHKYVTGRLTERPAQRAPSAKSTSPKHRV